MNEYSPVPHQPGATAPSYAQPNAFYSSTGLNAEREDEWSLSRVAMIFLNHWRMIAATTALFLLLGLFYIATATRLYTSSATLEVSGYAPLLPGMQVEAFIQQETKGQHYLKTQIAKLRRMTVADQVLSDEDLSQRFEKYLTSRGGTVSWALSQVKSLFSSAEPKEIEQDQQYYSHPKEFLQSYLELVSVQPVYGTSLVEVSVTSSRPELTRDLANAHAEGFIAHLRNERHLAVRSRLAFLKTEGQELEKRVAEAEGALAQYAEDNKLVALSPNEDVVVRELSELTGLLSKATARRIKAESLLAEVQSRRVEETDLLDNAAIRNTLMNLDQMEAEYAELSKKLTPLYPRMQQLSARIKSLKNSVESQRQQALRSVESDYKSSLETEHQLMRRIDEKKETAYEVSRRLVQYNILKREYESLKDLHQTILRQRKEAQLSTANESTNVSIADFAALPTRPSSPRKTLVLVFSLSFGLLAGIMYAVFKELFSSVLQSPEEASVALRLPTLAVIPSFNSVEDSTLEATYELPGNAAGEFEQVPGSNEPHGGIPQSAAPTKRSSAFGNFLMSNLSGRRALPSVHAALEAFRTLRTVLLYSSADIQPKVIMLTSATRGEGKSTVASNLAISLSRSSARVLLVDCDVRLTSIYRRFRIPENRCGLVDFLVGQCAIEDAIVKHHTNLDILPAGSIAPNAAELFNSQRMREFLEQVKMDYDYVVIDTPPVTPVADSLVLAPLCDSVLVVVRSEQTHRHVAAEALKRLRTVQAPIFGLVMNDFSGKGEEALFRSLRDSKDYIVPRTRTGGRKIVGSA